MPHSHAIQDTYFAHDDDMSALDPTYSTLDQGQTEARSFFAGRQFQSKPLKRRGRSVGWRAAAAAAGVMILAGRTASGKCLVAMEGERFDGGQLL